MKKIIQFRISLIREALSIHGITNIILFFLILFVSVGLIKVSMLKFCTNIYIDALVALFVYSIGIEFVCKEPDKKNIFMIKNFFNTLDEKKFYIYLKNKNFVIIQLIIFYLIFSVRNSRISDALIVISIFEILITFSLILNKYLGKHIWNIVKTLIVIGLGIALISVNRKKVDIELPHMRYMCILAVIISLIISVKFINESSDGIKIVVRWKYPRFITNNRNYLYVLKRGKLWEGFMICIMPIIYAAVFDENKQEILLGWSSCIIYILVYFYLELVEMEKNIYYMFYNCKSLKSLKKEKICDTIKIATVMAFVLIAIYTKYLSAIQLLFLFLIDVCLFAVTAYVYKFSYEKKLGQFVTDKERILFYLIASMQTIIVDFFIFKI